jgi:hypothetical protein
MRKTILGFHVASASRTGARDLLKAGAAFVALVDQNMIKEAHDAGAIVSYRTQRYTPRKMLDNPEGIDRAALADIPAIAATWMKAMIASWQQNLGAEFYLPNNEWDIGDLEAGARINVFALECMRIAEPLGYHLGIMNWSKGCPSDDRLPNGQACSMSDRLLTVEPALRHASEHGHALSLHVHADNSADLPNTGEHIAHRWKRIVRFCLNRGFEPPPILITELLDATSGWAAHPDPFLAALRWFDESVRADPLGHYVLGAAVYGFNAAETIAPIVPHFVRLLREAQPIAPPVPPPEPKPFRVLTVTCDPANADRLIQVITANGGKVQ